MCDEERTKIIPDKINALNTHNKIGQIQILTIANELFNRFQGSWNELLNANDLNYSEINNAQANLGLPSVQQLHRAIYERITYLNKVTLESMRLNQNSQLERLAKELGIEVEEEKPYRGGNPALFGTCIPETYHVSKKIG